MHKADQRHGILVRPAVINRTSKLLLFVFKNHAEWFSSSLPLFSGFSAEGKSKVTRLLSHVIIYSNYAVELT